MADKYPRDMLHPIFGAIEMTQAFPSLGAVNVQTSKCSITKVSYLDTANDLALSPGITQVVLVVARRSARSKLNTIITPPFRRLCMLFVGSAGMGVRHWSWLLKNSTLTTPLAR